MQAAFTRIRMNNEAIGYLAVPIEDGTFKHKGKTRKRITTRGWKLCVSWKDGSTSYERLSDLKEAYPILVAEYAEMNDLVKEPAFAWWLPQS